MQIWAKLTEEEIFVSKLTDCDAENTETEVWIMFSSSCKYISDSEFKNLSERCAEVGRMLGYIISHPEKYL